MLAVACTSTSTRTPINGGGGGGGVPEDLEKVTEQDGDKASSRAVAFECRRGEGGGVRRG